MNQVELTISGRSPEPSAARLVITLGLAGLLSGIALAGAFQVTKPIIDANKAQALREAVFKVVPGASRLQVLAPRDGVLAAVDDAVPTAEVVYAGYDQEGRFLGYAIVGAGAGFQDTIRILYGYDPAARAVIGMHVLESKETPGLGDRIFKDAAFQENFTALAVDPQIELVKDGRDADHEVDAITGATISSNAVVKIINAANQRWLDRLDGEPPPAPPAEPSQPAAADETDGGP